MGISQEALQDDILVEGGDIFEGTREQFKDCFFDNASTQQIMGWCKQSNLKLEINGVLILEKTIK